MVTGSDQVCAYDDDRHDAPGCQADRRRAHWEAELLRRDGPQFRHREEEGHIILTSPEEHDAAVVAEEGAGELREEAERVGERGLEDVERVEGDRVGGEEADGAEGDVERVAVGVEAGERQGRCPRLRGAGERLSLSKTRRRSCCGGGGGGADGSMRRALCAGGTWPKGEPALSRRPIVEGKKGKSSLMGNL